MTTEETSVKMNPKMIKIIAPIIILLVGIAGAFGIMQAREEIVQEPTKAIVPLVRTITASHSNVDMKVSINGSARSNRQIDLVSEVSGKITSMIPSFEAGAFFDITKPVILIDTADYDLTVQRANAALAQANANLDLEKANARVAREDWKDYGEGEPSVLVKREPQLASAKAKVASATADLATAMLNLNRCSITPEFSGRIVSERVEVGQFVRAGEVLAVIQATDAIEVDIALPSGKVDFIKLPLRKGELGSEATCFADIGRKTYQWSGRIVRSAAMVDTRTRTLGATIRIEKPFEQQAFPLLSGSFLRVEIKGRTFEDIFQLPSAAMRDRTTLLVVDQANRLYRRDVQVLRIDKKFVYIESGIEEGERVCLTTLSAVVDGMLVRIEKDADKSGKVSP